MKSKTHDAIGSLKGIAAELGVAPSSVSRALSGAKGVSPELREKALALAKKAGFAPDSVASSLRKGKPQGLVMITARSRSEVAILRDNALFLRAQEHFGRVSSMLFSNVEELSSAVAAAAASRPGAITLSNCSAPLPAGLAESLTARGIPLLTIDCGSKGLDDISIDRAAGTAQMARLFILSGAKKPVFLSAAPFSAVASDGRLAGIKRGLASLGVELLPEQVVATGSSSNYAEAGYCAAMKVLKSSFADAIFCYNDLCAIGVFRALLKSGARVPEDLLVAGFDNAPFAEYLPVSLSTVAQPVDELVELALELLRSRRENFKLPPRSREVKCSLVIRESAPVSSHALREKVFQAF